MRETLPGVTTGNSTARSRKSKSSKSTTTKPKKSSPDFPLFAHSRGYWAKKIDGKQINCAPWSDPDGALKFWVKFEKAQKARDAIRFRFDGVQT